MVLSEERLVMVRLVVMGGKLEGLINWRGVETRLVEKKGRCRGTDQGLDLIQMRSGSLCK